MLISEEYDRLLLALFYLKFIWISYITEYKMEEIHCMVVSNLKTTDNLPKSKLDHNPKMIFLLS